MAKAPSRAAAADSLGPDWAALPRGPDGVADAGRGLDASPGASGHEYAIGPAFGGIDFPAAGVG